MISLLPGSLKFPRLPKPLRLVLAALALACLTLAFLPAPAQAQHGDWLLGSFGLNGGSQAPPGVYYQNMFSYYHAGGNFFVQTSTLKPGPFHQVGLSLSLSASGAFDIFVDQNILVWTSKQKILGANYGCFIDIPFSIIPVTGNASLQPDLDTRRRIISGPNPQPSGGLTKGSIADIYVEPINLGWHFPHLDLTVSSGFFAPTGPYNPQASLNVGLGHWSGVFGLGGVLYADKEQTWALSVYSHYLMHGSQMGAPFQIGNVAFIEWGAGKTFKLNNPIVKQVTLGAVGYAQWQVSNNQVHQSALTPQGNAIINKLESLRAQIYAVGPGLTLLTKYGYFTLSYYEEFGAVYTPSGRQLIFSASF